MRGFIMPSEQQKREHEAYIAGRRIGIALAKAARDIEPALPDAANDFRRAGKDMAEAIRKAGESSKDDFTLGGPGKQ